MAAPTVSADIYYQGEGSRIEGEVAVVTGISRGLGQAIALGWAEAGADIVAVSRTSNPDLERRILDLGGRYIHLPADLTKTEHTTSNSICFEHDFITSPGYLDGPGAWERNGYPGKGSSSFCRVASRNSPNLSPFLLLRPGQ
jgi:hypothetical protein